MNQPVARVPDLDMRAKLMRLQNVLLADKASQVETPVTHHFSHGTYAREMFIPAGVTVVGKIHKFGALNILLSGDVSVLTESGIRRVQAGEIVESFPGIKRVAYAHVDSRWLTIHGTHEQDLAKIELEFIAQSYEEYDQFAQLQLTQEEKLCLGE